MSWLPGTTTSGAAMRSRKARAAANCSRRARCVRSPVSDDHVRPHGGEVGEHGVYERRVFGAEVEVGDVGDAGHGGN